MRTQVLLPPGTMLDTKHACLERIISIIEIKFTFREAKQSEHSHAQLGVRPKRQGEVWSRKTGIQAAGRIALALICHCVFLHMSLYL